MSTPTCMSRLSSVHRICFRFVQTAGFERSNSSGHLDAPARPPKMMLNKHDGSQILEENLSTLISEDFPPPWATHRELVATFSGRRKERSTLSQGGG